MIKGIGTDIIDINRIKTVIDRYGSGFLTRIFTRDEIELCGSKANAWVHFAGRWAAKEAFYKSLPLSCQSVSSWKSIQVLSAYGSEKPGVEVCSTFLKRRLLQEDIVDIHLSISHEQLFCIAFVVLE